jgi:hypothetical protein
MSSVLDVPVVKISMQDSQQSIYVAPKGAEVVQCPNTSIMDISVTAL